MSAKYDEAYVLEILKALKPGMTRYEFSEATRKDRNAGYHAEVIEAELRYFRSGK